MKILVIGGYGNFGKRLVLSLAQYYNFEITIAGRSKAKAQRCCDYIKKRFEKNIEYITVDVFSTNFDDLFQHLQPNIVVNATGPYHYQAQSHNYKVAEACIKARCHYVDLADDRTFVKNFSEALDCSARDSDVTLVTGASTVPGLTVAVIDHYLPKFKTLDSINYGISPGNKTERGVGTVGSILSYTGKPFCTLISGRQQKIYGWQGLEKVNLDKPLGKRWMSNCNIPDLDLLPCRYPSLNTVHFKAGLEVTLLHCGLWALSALPKVKLIKNLSRYTLAVTKMSEWFKTWGSDSGGMFINLKGKDSNNAPVAIAWQLIAENNVGPNVPTISTELVIKKISEGKVSVGATPCMGLFTLTEFFEVASRWGIYQREVSP